MGLYQGLPDKIPVVKQDFIFSAVSEELGGIFALCLIMVCFSCFLMFLNIAMQMKDQFYKLVALGLGTIYAFQVFLTIGGVTKFIPSTGVTLPLVSYGGSSLLSSMIIFAVIQGLYILRQDEGEINASKSRKNRQNRKKTTGFENADIEKLRSATRRSASNSSGKASCNTSPPAMVSCAAPPTRCWGGSSAVTLSRCTPRKGCTGLPA